MEDEVAITSLLRWEVKMVSNKSYMKLRVSDYILWNGMSELKIMQIVLPLRNPTNKTLQKY